MLRGVNGSGGGAPVGGTGTTNTIPRWNPGPSTLGDSIITQDTNARAIGVATASLAPWGSAYRAIQIGQSAAIMSAAAATNDAWYLSNGYWDGSAFRYTATGAALAYSQAATGHRWLYAASGTAGSPFSFADGMILNTSGNVGIGTASPAARLDVLGSTSAGYFRFRGGNTSAGYGEFQNSSGTSLGLIGNGGGGALSGGTASDLVLRAEANLLLAIGNSERARIDSSGNFGLGVSIPANAATSNGFYLKNNGNLSFLGPVAYFDVNSYYGASADRYAVNGFATRYAQINGAHVWYAAASGTGGNAISFSESARIDSNGNIYGTSGTTGMTNGFFYIPAAAGAPTGTPTAVSGRVPMYYDTTNNKFYVYNGAWKAVTLA